MKAIFLQVFASQDKNGVFSGAIARWMVGIFSGGVVYLGVHIPWMAVSPELQASLVGFATLLVQGALSNWVAGELGKGVKEMQAITNSVGATPPIPVDGVPGEVTMTAHREVAATAAKSA